MGFQKTEFSYFYDECIKCFGDVRGQEIFSNASAKLDEMKEHAEYRNNRAVKWHMIRNILPLIAIYQTYKEFGLSQDDAYQHSLEMAQIGARKKASTNAKLNKVPFAYSLFRRVIKHVMRASYPNAGWNVVWKRYDNEEIHFDMESCIYAEVTQKYNCPELCTVFCANDTTVFAGYGPTVIFERKGTIGNGDKVCDFHFKNGKHATEA